MEIAMKLSEAIRLGAMLKPQGRAMHSLFGTCALGAAADSLGILPAVGSNNGEFGTAHMELLKRWPILESFEFDPLTGRFEMVRDVVMSLNDKADWTREQIADWVATIEAQQEATTEQPQPVSVETRP
jgi:hypothetical protein